MELGGSITVEESHQRVKEEYKKLKQLESPTHERVVSVNTEYPLTSDYFQPVKSFEHKYSFFCNNCDLKGKKPTWTYNKK